MSIQFVPSDAQVFAGGAFTLLGYPEGADLGYVEAAGGNERLIEIPERVHQLAVLFDQLQTVALPADESDKLIQQKLESI